MRTLTNKYAGECRKCNASLPVGSSVIYERHVGIFCPNCAPTDPEEIRKYRQEAADKRADKYEEWAAKRREKAASVFAHDRPMTSDWAFITQPGHIPARARIIASHDQQYESLRLAAHMEEKAESLRHVRVKGDAAREDEQIREHIRGWIKIGMRVWAGCMQEGTVEKINKKTVRVSHCGASGNYTCTVPLHHIAQLKQMADRGTPSH